MLKLRFELVELRSKSRAGTALFVRTQGSLEGGSAGNAAAVSAAGEIAAQAERLSTKGVPGGIVLDCRLLEYTYGDAIGGMWIRHVVRSVPVVLLANAPVKARLESLIRNSLPVPVVESEEVAIRAIESAPGTRDPTD